MDAMCWSERRPDLGCWAGWTPCESWCGVQIVDGGRNGRHVLMWVASRFEMWDGMNAMFWSWRRPYWGCGAEWTPCVDVGGVQINV